jgi:hypothetical protein
MTLTWPPTEPAANSGMLPTGSSLRLCTTATGLDSADNLDRPGRFRPQVVRTNCGTSTRRQPKPAQPAAISDPLTQGYSRGARSYCMLILYSGLSPSSGICLMGDVTRKLRHH